MGSIFSKIIKGDIPSYKIAENDLFYAFLDINPVQKGHCLVVPKEEVDYIFDIEDQVLADMIVFSKRVAKAIKKVVSCNRLAVTVIGLEVPHAHIHLIPISDMSDLDFSKKEKIMPSEMKDLADRIASKFK